MARKKTVFITGAGGFIGRNLTEQLSAHYELLTPPYRQLDLTDDEAVAAYLREHAPDAVLHAASMAVSRKEQAPGLALPNLRMFLNLERNAKHYGRLIQFGSGAEYSKPRMPPRVREDYFGTHLPSDEYGFYKFICAKQVERMQDAIGIRLFGCFGKYEDWEIRFISNNIAKAVLGLPLTISNQNMVFSYLYVDDLAPVVRHFIERKSVPDQRFFNVTPNDTIDLLSIAKLINGVSGKKSDIRVNKPGMGIEYSGDNSCLRKEMPDFRTTPMKEAIRQLYGWYSEHQSMLNASQLAKDRY